MENLPSSLPFRNNSAWQGTIPVQGSRKVPGLCMNMFPGRGHYDAHTIPHIPHPAPRPDAAHGLYRGLITPDTARSTSTQRGDTPHFYTLSSSSGTKSHSDSVGTSSA